MVKLIDVEWGMRISTLKSFMKPINTKIEDIDMNANATELLKWLVNHIKIETKLVTDEPSSVNLLVKINPEDLAKLAELLLILKPTTKT